MYGGYSFENAACGVAGSRYAASGDPLSQLHRHRFRLRVVLQHRLPIFAALAGLDVAEYLVELLLRSLRALLGRFVERVSDLALFGTLRQALDELLLNLLFDKEPAAGRAALTAVEVDRVECPLDCLVKIGVGED